MARALSVARVFLALKLSPRERELPMSSTTRTITAALVLVAMAASTLAQDQPAKTQEQPAKQWVWIASQRTWVHGYQIQDGPHAGLWQIDEAPQQPTREVATEATRDVAAEPARNVTTEPAPEVAVATDPYGFAAILNQLRANAGLPALAYDGDLSNWAAHNNVAQSRRGLGHHVNPNCLQNCAWNAADATTLADMWIGSPSHLANMLSPSISRFGIAYGPGPYWTLNVQ
jgi:uncharacterized protein YkwD